MALRRDNFDAFCSLLAGLVDGLAAFLGVMAAVWIRFDSGLIPLKHAELFPPRIMYVAAAAVIAPLLIIIFRQIGLYIRPQLGPFGDKLPRLVRGVSITLATALALSFVVRPADWPPYSRTVALLAFFTVLLFVLLERFILFRLELHWARRTAPIRRIMIIGVDELAARLRRALEREPRLRSRLAGYLLPASRTAAHPPVHRHHPAGKATSANWKKWWRMSRWTKSFWPTPPFLRAPSRRFCFTANAIWFPSAWCRTCTAC